MAEPQQSDRIALALASAWLVIAVLTRIVRSRSLSRMAALLIWCYVAARVLGIERSVASAMDNMAITVGSFHLSALSALKIMVAAITMFWPATFIGNFAKNRLGHV